MKIKNLLVLGLTFASTTMMAQVVNEEFSAEQTKTSAEQGYYEFINLQPTDEGAEKVDKWTVSDGQLNIQNSDQYICSGQKWQRAIKFRNLPLTEKKLYRLSFDLKTNETYIDPETSSETNTYVDAKIMQGDENADICIQGSDASEQRVNYTLAAGDNKKYSKLFYFADLAKQNAAYETACAGKDNYAPTKFFAGINIYNPGVYVLDNVLLEEATNAVDSIRFNAGTIRVYFGDKINASELCNGMSYYVLDNSCVTVTVNGDKAEVLSAEVKSDGYLYIFLANELNGDETVSVSFTSPDAVKFTTAFEGVSPSFENVEAAYDGTLNEGGEITSYLFSEPALVSAEPADGTFALSSSLKEFKYKFDRTVYTSGDYAPKATLSTGEVLTLSTVGSDPTYVGAADGKVSDELVFTYSGEDFAKGSYYVILSGVTSEYGSAIPDNIKMTFEVGKAAVAKTIYTDLFTTLLTGANDSQPDGWTIMVGGENWAGGEAKADDKSACRNINVTGSEGEQTAFYLCDRAGYTYMQYGDKEGYNLTIPAGNIEFSVIALGHEATQPLEFRLEDLSGNVIATGTGTITVLASEYSTVSAASTISATFNNATEQQAILKVHASGGTWAAVRVLGFKARSITKTEGESFTPEVVCSGDFSSYTEDNTPKLGTGWKMYGIKDGVAVMKNSDQSCGWGGAERNITDGSRIKTVKLTGFNTKAMYFANANSFATYGQFEVQTEREGEVKDPETGSTIPEKTLNLNEARYQFTYYIAGWNNTAQSVKFEIFKFENGISGTPVYTRTDDVKSQADSGNGSGEGLKINFMWSAPAAGKYIIKVTSVKGECVFGNLSVETTASLAVQYAQMMNEALEPAKAELELANAKDQYAGTTRTALAKAIDDYSDPDFHTVAEYNAAIENVNNLVKAMKTRRSNIDAYPTCLAGIESGIAAAAGTKYEKLSQFAVVKEAYDKYNGADYVAMSDDELSEAIALMGDNGTLLTNMVNTCVPLLTNQLEALKKGIEDLGATLPANVSTAVDAAITDDQDLAYKLKLYYTKAIYEYLDTALSPFIKFDAETATEADAPIDATCFIQNPNFYCTTIPTKENDVSAALDGFPGWTVENPQGQITSAYNTQSWGGAYPTTVKPIVDCAARAGWSSTEFTVQQLINAVPVAVYQIGITIGEDGSTPHECYAFCGKDTVRYYSEETDFTYSRDESTPRTFENYTPQYDETTMLGSVNLGAYMYVHGGFINVDKATMTMTAKKEGFDYKAAAAAVQKLIDGLSVKGDVNGDGNVNISDVNAVISVMCGDTTYAATADVNNDGNVNISDVNAVITIMCGGTIGE